MALNKKSCIRIAAVIVDEFGPAIGAQNFLKRITNAANTNSRSFRKTMRRIAKAVKKQAKAPRPMRKAA